ncbi:MAG: hypothetical protein ACK53Y_21315, partial [bacterium]
ALCAQLGKNFVFHRLNRMMNKIQQIFHHLARRLPLAKYIVDLLDYRDVCSVFLSLKKIMFVLYSWENNSRNF